MSWKWKRSSGLGLAMLLTAALPAHGANLVVDNQETLERLADAMAEARAQIDSVRATVRSQTFVDEAGTSTLRMETGPTQWRSRGAQYRYETEERIPSMPDLKPAVRITGGGGGMEPSSSDIRSTPAGTSVTRRLVRARSGEAVIEVDPDRPREARIGSADQLHAALNIERLRHDPRHAGLTVLGATLHDLLRGGSWRLRPEDVVETAVRRIRWGGQREVEGRSMEIVLIDVDWEAKGHTASRQYEVLIDPERDYTIPRMIGTYILDGKRHEFESLTVDMTTDAAGHWLPRHAVHQLQLGKDEDQRQLRTVVDFESVVVNTPMEDAELKVVLEPGVAVYDHALQYRFKYTLGDDRAVVGEISRTLTERTRTDSIDGKVASATTIPVAAAMDPVGSAGWTGWIAGGVLAGGVLAGFMLLALRDGKEVR